ncbi:MAG: hypothetical protein L3J91_00030 [Thermoplasmata archaeon]|nr:hypothetical protein [Thermoplasmata archaeon]
MLLLPAAGSGATAKNGAAAPAASSLEVGALHGWSADPSPSHVGIAQRIGVVVLRDLPSSGPSTGSSPGPSVSTPAKFLHAGSSALADPAFVRPSDQVVGAGFEGLNDSQCGCAPPDVIDAVGPTQVVEMVNLWVQVWTKAGVPVRSVSAPIFFGSGSDFLSDPKVIYDNGSGRWFASIFDAGSTTGLVRFAVSSSSDATGSWTLYTSVTAPSGEFPDQPILGVSDHLVAFGGNMFSESTSAFFGAEYWVVDKPALLNGTSALVQSWGPDPNYLSIHPVQGLGPTSIQYFASSTSSSSTTVSLWAVSGVPPTATSVESNVTVGSYTTAPAGRAPGGGLIDSADTRVQGALWQSGDLWLAFDEQCTPSGDSAARACIRVVEVATASAEVLQDFDFGINGLDLYYPGIALDRAGDLTMVFGYSSTLVDPSGGVTGQATTDPAGSLQTYRTIVAGTGSLNCGGACRYGDYFGAAIDPTGNTVWVSAEFLTPLHAWDSWLAPVVTTGPATAVLTSTPAAIDAGTAATIGLVGENVTCSTQFGRYCAASVPLGDGSTATTPCSATVPVFAWTHTFNAVGTYDVGFGGYLSAFTSPSCTPGTEAVNLTFWAFPLVVASVPGLQLTASPANGADIGESINLSALAVGGRAPFTFAWSGLPTGCSPSTGPWVNCTATSTGSWIITVNATDANEVSRVQMLPFVVSPALSTSEASTRTLMDVGQEVTLVATGNGGSGSYGYLWTGLPTGCFGTNVSGLACTPTAPGTSSVQELTQDSNGVSALSGTIELTVAPALQVVLQLPSSTAPGASAQLSVTATGGNAPYSVMWTGLPAECAATHATQLSCTPTSAGSWSVKVTVLDSVGGSANATGTWSVSSPPGGLTLSPLVTLSVVALAVIAMVVIGLLLVRRRHGQRPRTKA